MTIELSKQLCELCGIKPKCINCGQTVSDNNPCKMPCTKQKYPDFGKPENCLKLIEILSNYMDDEDRGISITQNRVALGEPIGLQTDDSERKLDFKQKILKLLIDSFEFPFENDKKLKQSIREAEWVYG